MEFLRIIFAATWVICAVLAILCLRVADAKPSDYATAMTLCDIAIPAAILGEVFSQEHSIIGTIIVLIVLSCIWSIAKLNLVVIAKNERNN